MKAEILNFKCVGLSDGGKFPIEYTGRGQDISPEFILENLSPEAKTLAVVLEDLSHPIKDFTHCPLSGGREAGTGLWTSPVCGPQAAQGKNPCLPFYAL